jgi:hypothetical protein
MSFAPCGHLGAFGEGIRDMLLHFGDGLLIDQRALVGRALQAVADTELCHRGRQLLGEFIVNPFLDQQPVRAYASLPRVAVFAGDCALHRGIEVGIVEYDEGRIAAELERQLLDGAGALDHQLFTDLGRSGKG